MEKINVLQLGEDNWQTRYDMPDNIIWNYEDFSEEDKKRGFFYNVIFIDRTLNADEIDYVSKYARTYAVFITDEAWEDEDVSRLASLTQAEHIDYDKLEDFIASELNDFYTTPYGERFEIKNVALSGDFDGQISWKGNCSLELEGQFGEEYNQILYWRYNIMMEPGTSKELFLEYQADPEVDIIMKVTFLAGGNLGDISTCYEFTQQDLLEPVVISADEKVGAFISIFAKGNGRLSLISLHNRVSRRGHGQFLPGGERYVTSDKQEILFYFSPGDRKPPFNIYFSGYRTQEGFEGHNMLKSMGCPFLLISDPRLEGGSFYMGNEEYEKLMTDTIQHYIDELGFTSDQVVMSGISMGSTGAIYYGCDIKPRALILGKPLGNLGNVATNERLNRPKSFPTSLDVLMKICGSISEEAVEEFNNRFWDRFQQGDWSKTKFILSYLIEDDYDNTCYNDIISRLHSTGVQVYGKGIHGRHNDNTAVVVEWFLSQFKKLLSEDFGREV